jgi:hypothetical protein
LSCNASILMNDGIIMPQHFWSHICERTAWARQIMELCFSCFKSYHSQQLIVLLLTVALT